MTARVAIVGSLNLDLVVRTPRMPKLGETIIGGDFHTAPGGKGANQAVAAARMGAQVAMVGRVGSDAFGELLIDELAAAGVDHSHVSKDTEAATGVALIAVHDSGQNTIIVSSGANGRLLPADVDAAKAIIACADVLLLQLESPLETVTRAAEVAHAQGVKVILNPAPACRLPAALLATVDVLVPNESETAILTGRSVGTQSEVEAAAVALLELGVGTVVLTLGERGAMLARHIANESAPFLTLVEAFHVRPIDTTAAGDAFMAGLAVALAEGKPIAQAVRWGNAAGALATTKMGAQPSLPSREAVEGLLAEEILELLKAE